MTKQDLIAKIAKDTGSSKSGREAVEQSLGKDLADRIPPKIISFPRVPERDSIHVYYGDDLLEEKKHYYYSVGPPGTPHRIIMSKEFDVKFKKGAHFRVEFVPVRPENQASGRTRKI